MAEQIFCVVGGVALVLAGVALTKLRAPDWQSSDLDAPRQKSMDSFGRVQSRVRWINNRLIALIGGMIVCTAAIPHGRNWMLTWMAIFMLLLLCIGLAMTDATLSMVAYRRSMLSTLSKNRISK